MANTEIDSLSLDIKITGLKKEDVANIDKLSKAVSRLTKSLKEADFSKLSEIKVPKGIKNIQIITQNFRDAMNTSASKVSSNIQSEVEETSSAIEEQAQAVEDGSLVVEKASVKYQLGFIRLINWLRNFKKAEKEATNGKDKLKERLEKITKIMGRIKAIAFIKIIRAILNAIIQAVKAGVTNLAQFDKSFNETMSGMKSSITMIINSLGMILRPFIELIQPFLQSASQVVVQIANGVSKIQASMKGLSTYTKINAKYMEDFSKSSEKSSLFSFDTFNMLDTETNNMFETADVDEQEESNDELKTATNLLKNLQKLLSNVLELAKTIMSEVLTLIEYLMPVLNEILIIINNILEPILPFIKDLLTALNPLIKIILVDILTPLLKMLDIILKPIYKILEFILPIITDIVSLIVDVLSPILEAFEPLLTAINKILTPIMEIVTYIVDVTGGLISIVVDILGDILSPFIEGLKVVFGLIGDIAKIIGDIFSLDFMGFFTDVENMFKKLGTGLLRFLASLVDGTVNMFIDAINFIFVPLNKLSEWFNWGWELGIPHINLASLVPSFANGGIVGEVWQMNEYGNPEMLYNANGSNNTSVINQAQLSLAFEQAIYNTGLLDAIAKAGIIQLDGKAIAQSSTFKSELNRTNPSLNLR